MKLGTKINNWVENNPYAENIGQAIEGTIGAVGMFTNIAQTAKDAKKTQYDIPSLLTNNPYERPNYNLGAAWAQDSAFDPSEAGKGLIGESVISGVGAGASMGSLGGPWGTAIGAAAGAVTGLVGGIFGKKKAEENAAIAKAREQKELKAAQTEFNVEAEGYDERMDARDRYQKRLQNRQQNIQRMLG